MSGESSARCTNISDGLAGDGIGKTVVTVQGYDEAILFWTVETTLTRAEFDERELQDQFLSDDEIHELFELYNQGEAYGITFHIAELNNASVVIAKVYDYSVISVAELNRIWGVDDFEDSVTLSSAITGLEDRGAVCEVEMIEVEEETD